VRSILIVFFLKNCNCIFKTIILLYCENSLIGKIVQYVDTKLKFNNLHLFILRDKILQQCYFQRMILSRIHSELITTVRFYSNENMDGWNEG
jgi:hypothetical protein